MTLVVTASLVDSPRDIGTSTAVERRITASNAELLEQQVTTCLTLWAIEIQRSSMWLFHAVGLSDADGRTIALAAPSHTGKTTLAGAAGSQWGYVTDETVAVVPDSLAVIPYEKPFSVIVRPGEPKRQVGPDELRLERPVGDLRLVRLGLLSRLPGMREPRIERIGLREALFELAPQISLLGGRPRPLQALGDLVARLGGATRVSYSESEDLSDVLGSLFAEPQPIAIEYEPDELMGCGVGEVRADCLRRSPGVTDAVWVDGSLVVLSGTKLVQLDGLGPVLWEELAEPAPPEALYGRLRARFPAPPGVDTRAAFEAAVAALRDSDVISGGPDERIRVAPQH